MKRKSFAVIQTIILIVTIVVNTHPGAIQAAPAAPESIIEDTNLSPTGDDIQSSDVVETFGTDSESGYVGEEEGSPSAAPVPHRTITENPSARAPVAQNIPNSNADMTCAVRANVIAFRPQTDTGSGLLLSPDRLQFPVTRPAERNDPNQAEKGWDILIDTPTPGLTNPPRPGGPGGPPDNQWPDHPDSIINSSIPIARMSRYPSGNVNYPNVMDLRVDPTGNYTAVRGEEIVVMIHLRNTTFINCLAGISDIPPGPEQDANSPAVPAGFPEAGTIAIPAGTGQNVIFNSATVLVNTVSAGTEVTVQQIPLARTDFWNTYTPNQNLNTTTPPGLLERRQNNTNADIDIRQRSRFSGDYVALIPVTIPETAEQYLEFELTNLTYSCTYTGNGCDDPLGPVVQDNDEQNPYYVSTIGGPWLYRTGDSNPTGFAGNPQSEPNPFIGYDPFQVLHLVGGTTVQREVGQTAWFVLEIKNKWDTTNAPPNTVDTKNVRTVVYASGDSLDACNGNGATGTAEPLDGWYSSLNVGTNGPVNVGTDSIPIADPTSMLLGGQQSVFCVFRKTLLG